MSDRRRKKGEQPRQKPIRIDICCNDPDNGLFDHVACEIQIGIIELESLRWPYHEPRFVLLEGDRFRLSGKVWPYVHTKYGVGNWCWDGFWLEPLVAANFVNWLRKRKLFDMTVGPSVLHDWFDSDGLPMEPRLLAMLLEEAFDS